MTMPEIVRRETLNRINEIRAEIGYPILETMPKGIVLSNENCPVARAFPVKIIVGSGFVSVFCTDDEAAKIEKILGGIRKQMGAEYGFRIPPEMISFIMYFDGGHYPELRIHHEQDS